MTEKQRAEKRRILRGLVQRSSSDILNASRARQMAGDGGEDKRFPKRPFHGEGDENASATENENVKIPPGKKTSSDARRGKEQRGKENACVLTHCRSSGSTEAKMDQTVVCGSQTRVEPGIFFDEDSNHIFPVEQFFGNMDVVQEYQRRSPGSKRMSRKEYRSQHFYAKEESEDEQL
ncbi:UPF0688 protein C1orf174 -like protein [Triplophysa tibetana]|uniref:UPF0688 protein C1orf174-like protein n=1 Tax=Triplophysa tibetana TaxID=1572043 RepID=A0A5A9P071_9TELE|nr:UPF0688 protein C1orf174 -like protein [Triplophysa tibetana]